jgi:hypothetical protein
MDNLISLIIDLLGTLFGERGSGKPKDSPPANRPDPSRPRPQPRPTTWEDELRRLLDGQNQSPAQQPPPLRQPPPPLSTIARTPPVAAPATISPTGRLRPAISPPALPPGIQIASRDLATLSESQQAYARASQIDKSAAARVAQATTQPVLLTFVERTAASPDLVQAVSFFRNARSARQAVIASVILGVPRAFEEPGSAYF